MLHDQQIPLAIIAGITVTASMIALAVAQVMSIRMRIRHGYPLESSWGKPIYPKTDQESVERIRLLSQENAQLRAEIGAIKDRLGNVERIVTDGAHTLDREIEALRGRTN